ncbi:MAG: DNA polymerase III subunit delta [Bacteroidota bacterium]
MTYLQILQQIKQGKFAPVYYLHGEEGYFMDKIVQALDTEGVVLQAGEAAFNREVFYGPDAKASQVINACRSFPVMANRRLVILKEAHRMAKPELEKLGSYAKQVVPSSVLVLVFKDRKAGLGKKVVGNLKGHLVDFHARKMYERDVQQWCEGFLKDSGFQVEAGAAGILVEHLGTNLNLIENELDKIFIQLKAKGQTQLTKNFLFQMIDIDKEFNVFELIKAMTERKVYRCHLIVDRLTQNVKNNPPTVIVSALFRFFDQVALVHKHKLRDPNSIKSQLGVNYFQARDYATASQTYHRAQVYRNIGLLQDADLRLKGQIPTQMNSRHILKTLVWQLLQ